MRYEYAMRAEGKVVRFGQRKLAEAAARDYAISPLRIGPRTAELVRRRDWTFAWETIATWTSPEGHR